MLGRSRRLRAAEARATIKAGWSRRGIYISMKYTEGGSPLRAAAVVSKSLAKKAVARNRLRRALYRALASLPSSRGQAVFFIQKIPPEPYTVAFKSDLAPLLTTRP